MIKVIWKNTLAVLLVTVMLLTAVVTPASAAASTVTVPQGVTPVKSWTVVVGTTYKIPEDQKQAGDTYASSDTSIVTVNASTGQFAPQAAGVAYIVATNGGQSRYFKVTVSTTVSTAPATSVFDGYAVTVLDTTTPAVTIAYYEVNGVFASYFKSASGTVLGSISLNAHRAILQAGTESGVRSMSVTGDEWMAEQFNLYRGIGYGQSDIASATAVDTEAYAQEVIRLVNEKREEVGQYALEIDSSLMSYSAVRAEELSIQYSHERPNGEKETSECIYRGGTSPSAAFQAWMNSEPHKRAILNETGEYKYNYIGAGCYADAAGTLHWVITFSK